jgi:hypothetical protein
MAAIASRKAIAQKDQYPPITSKRSARRTPKVAWKVALAMPLNTGIIRVKLRSLVSPQPSQHNNDNEGVALYGFKFEPIS